MHCNAPLHCFPVCVSCCFDTTVAVEINAVFDDELPQVLPASVDWVDAKTIWDLPRISFASVLWLWPLACWSNCGSPWLLHRNVFLQIKPNAFPNSWLGWHQLEILWPCPSVWRSQSFLKWVFLPGISNNIYICFSNLPQKRCCITDKTLYQKCFLQ